MAKNTCTKSFQWARCIIDWSTGSCASSVKEAVSAGVKALVTCSKAVAS